MFTVEIPGRCRFVRLAFASKYSPDCGKELRYKAESIARAWDADGISLSSAPDPRWTYKGRGGMKLFEAVAARTGSARLGRPLLTIK